MVNRAALRTVRAGLMVSILVSGCSPSQQTPATGTGEGRSTAAGTTATSTGAVAIDFRSQPDPPKSGDNTVEVTVRQPDGTPITDAAVTVVFSMPAMPAMNMPAMRSEAKLTHVAGGVYRGMGQLSMAGTWNVTVTAARNDESLGRRSFSIVAK